MKHFLLTLLVVLWFAFPALAAPITFVADGGYTDSGTSPVAMAIPNSTCANGNLMVMFVAVISTSLTSSITTPSGWTYVTDVNGTIAGGGYVDHLYVFYKYFASDPSTVNVSGSASAGFAGLDGNIRCYKNTATSNPINSFKSVTTASGSGTGQTVTIPALTETFSSGEIYLAMEMSTANFFIASNGFAPSVGDYYSNTGINNGFSFGDYFPSGPGAPGSMVMSLGSQNVNTAGDEYGFGISILPIPAPVTGVNSMLVLTGAGGGGLMGPVIASGNPASQTASVGGMVTFTASVSGSPTPTCQWYKNGGSLGASATSCSSLTYPLTGTLLSTDNGDTFYVIATNSHGSTQSQTATLTVITSNTFDAFGLPNPPSAPNNTVAVPALAFNTSIGVNVCGASICCSGCGNGSGSQSTDIAEMAYTGVLTLRQQSGTIGAGGAVSWMVAIAQGTASAMGTVGAPKYCMLADSASSTSDLSTIEIAAANTLQSDGLLRCMEGLNEPSDCVSGGGTVCFEYNGVQCGQGAADWKSCGQYMTDLHGLVRGDSALNGVPLLGISDTGGQIGDYGLQFAWPAGIPAGGGGTNGYFSAGTVFSDGGVLHNYNDSQNHYSGGVLNNIPNLQWDASNPYQLTNNYSFYGDYLGLYSGCCSGSSISTANAQDVINYRRITTETWADGCTTSGGFSAGDDCVAVGIVNTYIDAFMRGIKVTEPFSLVSANGAPGYGYYNYQNSPPSSLPAADAVHSLTHFMIDTGDVLSPGTVSWSNSNFGSVCGTGGSLNEPLCHGLLVQKSASAVYHPNSYVLLLTYEPGYNGSTISLPLTLGRTFTTVNVFDATAVVTPGQNSPSSPTPVVSCSSCSSITIPWTYLGHAHMPPPLLVEMIP